MSRARIALLVVAVVAIAAAIVIVRSSHATHKASLLSPAETTRVARFARNQARTLGDPRLASATVILGPQTARAIGSAPGLPKTQALIILRGRFHCDHCHDAATAGLGFGHPWHATAIEYTVYWPTLAVLGQTEGDGAHALNLPPASRIKRLVTITL